MQAPASHSKSDARPATGSPGAEIDEARALIRAEAAAVAQLESRIGPSFHTAVELIVRCAQSGGTVVVTGLGKSGLIGAKISATFASLGIPSHWIHPTDAAHGDLGRFRRGDICLALSYSGMTEEVVGLAGALKQDGLPIISISRGPIASSADSTSALERLASASLSIGDVDEATGLGPAPMCSSTAMLALGDALALAASRRMCFTDDDFLKRHPGGALGGLLRPVVDVLRFQTGRNLASVPETATVAAALKLAEEGVARRPGAVLIVDPSTGRLTGIFTDADFRRLVLRDPADLGRPIRDVMTRSPGTLRATALVRDAVNMVREFRRDEIPIVDDDGCPVGLLDVQDLIALRVVQGD